MPELYLALPSEPGVPQPPLQLKGYQKVQLAPGQSATISFPLNDRSFAYWDTPVSMVEGVAAGCYGVEVGSSTPASPLSGTIARLGANCGADAVAVTAPDHSATSAVLPAAPLITDAG